MNIRVLFRIPQIINPIFSKLITELQIETSKNKTISISFLLAYFPFLRLKLSAFNNTKILIISPKYKIALGALKVYTRTMEIAKNANVNNVQSAPDHLFIEIRIVIHLLSLKIILKILLLN
ncbi:hypothetical protein B1158_00205 [Enterococcus faecium]|nr:hypothetical protein B1158_00205 [Enterococcus faecium]